MGDPAQAEPSPRPGGEPAPGRAAWGSLSREDIVAAAAGIVTAGGHEEMSIRSLAASLGVAPMSLYRHIRDKDDLLGEVTDRLLAGAWRPAAAEDDWQAWITEAASRLRDFLVSQPAALHVYLTHPVVSPAAIDRMNAMMSVLRRSGAQRGRGPQRLRGAAHLHDRVRRPGGLAGRLGRHRRCQRRGRRPPRPATRRVHHHRAVHHWRALPAPGNQRPRRGNRAKRHVTRDAGPGGRDEEAGRQRAAAGREGR